MEVFFFLPSSDSVTPPPFIHKKVGAFESSTWDSSNCWEGGNTCRNSGGSDGSRHMEGGCWLGRGDTQASRLLEITRNAHRILLLKNLQEELKRNNFG